MFHRERKPRRVNLYASCVGQNVRNVVIAITSDRAELSGITVTLCHEQAVTAENRRKQFGSAVPGDGDTKGRGAEPERERNVTSGPLRSSRVAQIVRGRLIIPGDSVSHPSTILVIFFFSFWHAKRITREPRDSPGKFIVMKTTREPFFFDLIFSRFSPSLIASFYLFFKDLINCNL